jgi:hypothetical protein
MRLAGVVDLVPATGGDYSADYGASGRSHHRKYAGHLAPGKRRTNTKPGARAAPTSRCANHRAGARASPCSNQRVPLAVPLAFGRNVQDTLPVDDLLTGRCGQHKSLVSDPEEFAGRGFCVFLHDSDGLAGRQLPQVVSGSLILVAFPEGWTGRHRHRENKKPQASTVLHCCHLKSSIDS